jgi:hypothetical protein
MSVVFTQGEVLGRGDLDIFMSNATGNPTNVYEITYAIYYVDPTTQQEVLIGSPARTPVNPSVGEYYASLQVPGAAAPGDYLIRWLFRETSTTAQEGAVQEFGVVSEAAETSASEYSGCVTDLIRKMRFLTRDNCLAGETHITVDADGERITITLAELHEIIGDVSPPPPM